MKGQRAEVGDTRVAPNKYHYTRTADGWRLTHHLTAEKALNRPIGKDEMVRFKPGFSRDDYDNPDAIEVIQKGKSSKARRMNYLEGRIEEMQQELESLRST